MGSGVSKEIEDEKTKWAAHHSLRINEELKNAQIDLLDHFKEELYTCWRWRHEDIGEYQHYFVTDLIWTIEFRSPGVAIHRTPVKPGYFVDAAFKKPAR